MVVTGLVLDVAQCLRPGTAGLVDRDDGPRREVLLLDQTLQQAGNLVSATPGTRHDDQLDGLFRGPIGHRRSRKPQGRRSGNGNWHSRLFLSWKIRYTSDFVLRGNSLVFDVWYMVYKYQAKEYSA